MFRPVTKDKKGRDQSANIDILPLCIKFKLE